MPKFNPKQKLNKTNINEIPENKAIIYEFLNNSGKNVYTGISSRGNIQNRLNQHLLEKNKKIQDVTHFKYLQVKNKNIARKKEKQIIKNEKPKYNIQDK